MLETRRLTANIRLEFEDFRNVLRTLPETGWTPAILSSESEFLRLAGLDRAYELRGARRPSPYWNTSGSVSGDVFFSDREVYFLLQKTDENSFVIGLSGEVTYQTTKEGKQLEVGLISRSGPGLDEKLATFATVVETTITRVVDGRKTRHMTFGWSAPADTKKRLAELQKPAEGMTQVQFETASLSESDVSAARSLSSPQAREILQELSQAGFARERDILSRRSKKSEEVRAAIEEMNRTGLVRTEHLLICKRHGVGLTRLSSPTQIAEAGIGGLICGSCGSPFSEETLLEGYAPSDLGRRLIRGSRWMTIWITDLLVQLGVPLESILWNMSESSEEVDVVAEFLGQLWILELKDREFGAGDAHPFNYRRVRYHAQKAIVVTTDKISTDAKRIFKELQQESESKSPMGMVLVEGLSAASDVLEREVSAAALKDATARLEGLTELTGFDFSGVVARRFAERPASEKEAAAS